MNQNKLSDLAKTVGQDWTDGPYYDEAERSMDQQWRLIWPIIEGSDFSTTVDLAAGHGRNTARLLDHASKVFAVDINQSNIDYMRQRFGARDNLVLMKNDGADFGDIASGSISFVYSFDAMVHFDSDIVRAYIKEFRRVMKPGARGFCHYSNNDTNPTGSYRDHPGWRNFMSRQLFEHWLTKEGFKVLRSDYILGVAVLSEKGDGADATTFFELPKNAEAAPSQGGFEEDPFDLRRQLAVAQTENTRLKDEIAAMLRSKSWRWTSFLRTLRGGL